VLRPAPTVVSSDDASGLVPNERRATLEGMDPELHHDPSCPSGICSSSAPPLVGSVLTGTGLTLDRAARLVADGEDVPLSDVQRRIVEERVLTLGDEH